MYLQAQNRILTLSKKSDGVTDGHRDRQTQPAFYDIQGCQASKSVYLLWCDIARSNRGQKKIKAFALV